jgi:hypothetical protein
MAVARFDSNWAGAVVAADWIVTTGYEYRGALGHFCDAVYLPYEFAHIHSDA